MRFIQILLGSCSLPMFRHKPLKTLWAKSVLKFHRENPRSTVTKETFAAILKGVLENLRPDVIKQGFKSCIFPWNASAIDYSKCLGKNIEKKKCEDGITITFSKYKSIIGEDRLRLFENMNEETYEDENLFKLYQIYKEFMKTNSE